MYGLAAEFDSAEAILAAARQVHAAGYRRAEAYTPFPVDGLSEALGMHHTPVPLLTLIGGIIGGAGGFFMCWYANVLSFPLNIGGKPYNSWPAWIPITFEMTVLLAALTAAISMLALNGLPRLHHPVFGIPTFDDASKNKFFLVIETRDPLFELDRTQAFLASLEPGSVWVVPEK